MFEREIICVLTRFTRSVEWEGISILFLCYISLGLCSGYVVAAVSCAPIESLGILVGVFYQVYGEPGPGYKESYPNGFNLGCFCWTETCLVDKSDEGGFLGQFVGAIFLWWVCRDGGGGGLEEDGGEGGTG